jgi:hypothetical protein
MPADPLRRFTAVARIREEQRRVSVSALSLPHPSWSGVQLESLGGYHSITSLTGTFVVIGSRWWQ